MVVYCYGQSLLGGILPNAVLVQFRFNLRGLPN